MENDRRFLFCRRWLRGTGALIAAIGVAIAVGAETPLLAWWSDPILQAFWTDPVAMADAQPFRQWMFALCGMTLASWGVLFAVIAHIPFGNRERWAWFTLLAGVLIWVPADIGLSAYFGLWGNLRWAIAALVPVIPLGLSWRYF